MDWLKKYRKNLGNNLLPYGYNNVGKRLFDAVLLNKKDEQKDSREKSEGGKERADFLKLIVDNPQKFNSLSKSKYRPTTETDSTSTYYNSPVTEDEIRLGVKEGVYDFDKIKENSTREMGESLGHYKLGAGEDKQGKYLSYYDKWNLNPVKETGNPTIDKKVDNFITKYLPNKLGLKTPEVYGRVYLKQKGGKMKEDKEFTLKDFKKIRKNLNKESFKPADILDIPQKALMYGATTVSRGIGNGVYARPSDIMSRDWNNKNKSLQLAADITLDPLNFIPLAKGKGINLMKNIPQVIPGITNIKLPWKYVNKWNKARTTIQSVDMVDDIYNFDYSKANGGKLNNMKKQKDLDKELEVAIEVEMEHKPTFDWIKKYHKEKGKFPSMKQVAKSIGVDHMKDFKKIKNKQAKSYYQGLVNNSLSDEVTEYKESKKMLLPTNEILEIIRKYSKVI